MKQLFSVVLALAALLALLAMPGAHAGRIGDIGINTNWGADNRVAGDVIGASTYDINGTPITRAGSVVMVTIASNVAGNAGSDTRAAQGGIGYGEVFLSRVWNPLGTDANRNSGSSGTKRTQGRSPDNRLSDSGGTFKLYQLNDAATSSAILNADSFIAAPPVPGATARPRP